MEITGAEITVRCLQEEGVEFAFGYPGGAVLYIYDEIFKQNKVKHVLVRHEQAAVHAADGYARATGRVGVALVTSGPGATNAVTGIATAYMDSIPMVIISGQVPTAAIGLDLFKKWTWLALRALASSTTSWSRMSEISHPPSRRRFISRLPAALGRWWWIFRKM